MSVEGQIDISYVANFWLNDVKKPLMKALESAPENKLNWAPADNMMSLGNVFLHIVETGEWWIGTLIDGGTYKDRISEKSPPKGEIKKLLDEHWLRLQKFFERSPQVLEKKYPYHDKERNKTREFEGRWIMLHLLEHDIHHRCQIFQYLRILGIAPPRA
jgi:uncharacterized damage-inducible protein DinB